MCENNYMKIKTEYSNLKISNKRLLYAPWNKLGNLEKTIQTNRYSETTYVGNWNDKTQNHRNFVCLSFVRNNVAVTTARRKEILKSHKTLFLCFSFHIYFMTGPKSGFFTIIDFEFLEFFYSKLQLISTF